MPDDDNRLELVEARCDVETVERLRQSYGDEGDAQAPDPTRDRCVCGVAVGGRTGAVHICGRWLHRAYWDRLDNTVGAVERPLGAAATQWWQAKVQAVEEENERLRAHLLRYRHPDDIARIAAGTDENQEEADDGR